ncbi:FTR1 family iron permease [Paenibacillus macerans]|uniref:FTR1 family iron permease n=1 Tax=Paenibacillus macerans TaxID=44252 RepID=UPI003D31FE90
MSVTPFEPRRSPAQAAAAFRSLRIAALLLLCLAVFHAGSTSRAVAASQQDAAAHDSLLPLVGGALVEAGAGNWDQASADLAEFEAAWNNLKPAPAGETASGISASLAAAKGALQRENPEEAGKQLSALAKQVNQFIKGNSEQADFSAAGKEAAGRLLEMAKNTIKSLDNENLAEAQTRYKEILNGWSKMEGPIRSGHFGVYSDVETHMSLIRIALQAQPAKTGQAVEELKALAGLLQNYMDGKLEESSTSSLPNDGGKNLPDALALLREADKAVKARDAEQAASQMQAFIVMWPAVEGEVSISSASVYTSTENRMTEAQSYLLSSPPEFDRAMRVIGQMIGDLGPLAGKTSYSAWDAALILLREGLEAILVLAALLAFAKRANQTAARRFIWAGAGTGLALSAALAVLLTYAVAQAVSGGARELIEGIIGLLAVVMMLAVGHFFHSKSSAQAWNSYVAKQVGGAMERGSMWSLFLLSGLAILREGAETAIFYIGMAPNIEPAQLLTGMLGAAAALGGLGFVIIRFSVKLPVKPFMLAATLFIYYLVLRFLGESLHALQVAGVLPTHSQGWLPAAGWLGAYPTWETFAPQSILLLFIVWRLLATERRKETPALP